jgi:trigger factor
MAVTVETLEKLERKMTLALPMTAITGEVETRLKRMARQVKMDGFRPGKVPFNVVAQRYGYSVHYEVMNDKVGEAFAAAANEAQLRVAGNPAFLKKKAPPKARCCSMPCSRCFQTSKLPTSSPLKSSASPLT